jgi:succinate-acetate transporter protein
LNGNPPGIRTAVEGTRSQDSIVLLVVAVVLWILFAVPAVTQAADETGSYRIGAFIGRLLGSLLIAFLVRAG